ncbi:MAG: hypothetical protein AB1649_16395, partial [Chloroflexota bacterium]
KKELIIILWYARGKQTKQKILTTLYRLDLWLFPPLAFLGTFKATLRLIPTHPIAFYAIMATSFMAATLTLFLIRPPKKVTAHWI